MNLIEKANQVVPNKNYSVRFESKKRYYYHYSMCGDEEGACDKCSLGYKTPYTSYGCKMVLSRVITAQMSDNINKIFGERTNDTNKQSKRSV